MKRFLIIFTIIFATSLMFGATGYALGYLYYNENEGFFIRPGFSLLDTETIQALSGSGFTLGVLQNIAIVSEVTNTNGVIVKSGTGKDVATINSQGQLLLQKMDGVSNNPRIIYIGQSGDGWNIGMDNNEDFYIRRTVSNGTSPSTSLLITNAGNLLINTLEVARDFRADAGLTAKELSVVRISGDSRLDRGRVIFSGGTPYFSKMTLGQTNAHTLERKNGTELTIASPLNSILDVQGDIRFITDICITPKIIANIPFSRCLKKELAANLRCEYKIGSSGRWLSDNKTYVVKTPSCDANFQITAVGCSTNPDVGTIKSTYQADENGCVIKPNRATPVMTAYAVCCQLQ